MKCVNWYMELLDCLELSDRNLYPRQHFKIQEGKMSDKGLLLDEENDEFVEPLLPEDNEWIEAKLHSNISPNARFFLEEIRRDMRDVFTFSNQIYIDEKYEGNAFGLFFVRSFDHYFTIGTADPETRRVKSENVVDSFTEAMEFNLAVFGIDDTLWGYLSSIDFVIVRYGRNFDLM